MDAISRFTEPKNIKLFSDLNVLTEEECRARRDVLFNYYIGVVEIEVTFFMFIIVIILLFKKYSNVVLFE